MKGKKFFSFAAALVLLLSMSVPALAASGGKKAVKISAEMRLPTIRLIVPSTLSTVINPYGLTVSMGDVFKSDPILYPDSVQAISSQSDVPIQMSITASGKVNENSDMELKTSSLTDQTEKAVYMYCEMKSMPASALDIEEVSEFNAKFKEESVDWDDSVKKVVQPEGSATSEEVLQLEPADANGNPVTYAFYRLGGEVATGSEILWTADDSISITVAFTFTAMSYV